MVRVVRGEVTLSVQDLVCDGCRGVSVEGGFVGVVGGVWHFGGLLEGVFVWCGWCVWRLRCRFRIWCVMVAVGCRLRVALLVLWVACGTLWVVDVVVWLGLVAWVGVGGMMVG